MKGKRIAAAALAAALTVCMGCGKTEEEPAEEENTLSGTAVEVVEAELNEMRAEYSLTGKIGAVNEVQVIPLLAGQVKTLNVDEGDRVSNGQTLFTVDTSSVTSTLSALRQSYNSTKTATDKSIQNAELAVTNAQSSVDQAKRSLNQALLGVDSAKRTVENARNGVAQANRAVEQAMRGVESANAAVNNAQIGVDQAQEASDNAHALFEVGAAAEQDVTKADQALEQAKTALESARRGVVDAESAQANAQAAVTQAQSSVADAEAGVVNANKTVEDARAGVTSAQRGVSSAQATAAQARAQQTASLAQIQASIDQINAQAELGTVKAPCAGTVTAVNIKRGSVASSAQPAVVIAEGGDVEVKVSVAEDVFTNIRAGDEASVSISSVSEEPLTGRVGTLPVSANAQTSLYDVTVDIPSSSTKPQIGAFATVTFYTDRREDTIAIPTEAILTGDNDEKFIFVADGDTAARIVVETGLVNDTDTEIVSGLNEGDLVVVKGQSYLSDGALIRIVNSPDEDEETENSETEDYPDDGEDDDWDITGDDPDENDKTSTPDSKDNDDKDGNDKNDMPFRIGTPKDALSGFEEG